MLRCVYQYLLFPENTFLREQNNYSFTLTFIKPLLCLDNGWVVHRLSLLHYAGQPLLGCSHLNTAEQTWQRTISIEYIHYEPIPDSCNNCLWLCAISEVLFPLQFYNTGFSNQLKPIHHPTKLTFQTSLSPSIIPQTSGYCVWLYTCIWKGWCFLQCSTSRCSLLINVFNPAKKHKYFVS